MAFEAIQSLVQRAIGRFPERVAVQCPQGLLSYAELDQRADRLSRALLAAGAGSGSLIPVLSEDRRDTVVAMLSILRIGGAFVPLDLAAPRVRLEQMLADTEPRVVVTGSAPAAVVGEVLAAAAPSAARVVAGGDGAPTGSPDGGPGGGSERRPDGGPAAGSGNGAEAHRPAPDDPCYVFYTSGSTGRPKGIVGRLAGIDHFIRWETDLLGVEPGWRVSQLTSPAFDAVLRDVFVPLTTGGTVCVPPTEVLLDPAALARWLDAEQINLVHCVPSLFRGLVGEAASGAVGLAALRCVALSGEKLPPGDAARWLDTFGDRIRLLNLYGPSETTMTKTYHFVTAADTRLPSIPIGRPIPGAEVLLLDGRGAEVDAGSVGEIHLRTAHRSLGYHRQPEATAQAFVPHPTGNPGDILYRTGDFGRLLPDGTLEFLGRKDHQVKIGGVRVELGGVESALREHPAVADAAVVVAEENGSLPYLCAFVELARGNGNGFGNASGGGNGSGDGNGAGNGAGGEPDSQELRAYLRQRLPDSAVPAVFVPLEELPRTISGKIDRRALPAPVRRREEAGADAVPPRTPTEQAVARLWTGVLPVDTVDVRRSFFDSGGSSLLVIELISRLTAEFGTDVPLVEFLAAPTIESLARLVESSILTGEEPLDDLFDSLTDIDAGGTGVLARGNGGTR